MEGSSDKKVQQGSKYFSSQLASSHAVKYKEFHYSLSLKSLIDGLNSSLPNIPDSAQLVFLGDFNVNYSESTGGEKRKLARVVALHNLEQFITQPTRITTRSSTLFDFLFCNTSQRVVDHGVIHLAWSDHSPVYCVLKVGVTKAPQEQQNIGHGSPLILTSLFRTWLASLGKLLKTRKH